MGTQVPFLLYESNNFLPETEFYPMQQMFLSEEFPWFYNPRVVGDEQTNHELYQMCHSHVQWEWQSQYRNLVAPVLNRLDILQPLRIKLNF